jgi:hypothetical protein
LARERHSGTAGSPLAREREGERERHSGTAGSPSARNEEEGEDEDEEERQMGEEGEQGL